jgi:hypothetical protein
MLFCDLQLGDRELQIWVIDDDDLRDAGGSASGRCLINFAFRLERFLPPSPTHHLQQTMYVRSPIAYQ